MSKLNLSDEGIQDFIEFHRGYRPTDPKDLSRCRRIVEGTVLTFFSGIVRASNFHTFFLTPLDPDATFTDVSCLSSKQRRLFSRSLDTGDELFELAVQLSTDDAYRSIAETGAGVCATFLWRKDLYPAKGTVHEAGYVERCMQALAAAREDFDQCKGEGLQVLRLDAITGQLPRAVARRQKLWLYFDGEKFARSGSVHPTLPSAPGDVVADIGSFFHGQDKVLAAFTPHRWTVVGHGRVVVVQLFSKEGT